jgi:phage shock protein C
MLAGVAGGLAHYFGIDPVLVRLGFVLLTVTTGVGLPAYIILAIVTPEYPEGSTEPASATAGLATDRGRQVGGFFLLALGLVFLAANFGWLNFLQWGRIWPVFLVLAGIFLLLNRHDKNTG